MTSTSMSRDVQPGDNLIVPILDMLKALCPEDRFMVDEIQAVAAALRGVVTVHLSCVKGRVDWTLRQKDNEDVIPEQHFLTLTATRSE